MYKRLPIFKAKIMDKKGSLYTGKYGRFSHHTGLIIIGAKMCFQ